MVASGSGTPFRPPAAPRPSPLKTTLAEHAAGNYRLLMNLGNELLAVAAERELPRLDEKLFLEVFQQPAGGKAAAGKKRASAVTS